MTLCLNRGEFNRMIEGRKARQVDSWSGQFGIGAPDLRVHVRPRSGTKSHRIFAGPVRRVTGFEHPAAVYLMRGNDALEFATFS
jgi:hypothetical protein